MKSEFDDSSAAVPPPDEEFGGAYEPPVDKGDGARNVRMLITVGAAVLVLLLGGGWAVAKALSSGERSPGDQAVPGPSGSASDGSSEPIDPSGSDETSGGAAWDGEVTVEASLAGGSDGDRVCPGEVAYTGTIQVTKDTTVSYRWIGSDGRESEIHEAEIAGGASAEVEVTWTYDGPNATGTVALQVLEPVSATSEQVDLEGTCSVGLSVEMGEDQSVLVDCQNSEPPPETTFEVEATLVSTGRQTVRYYWDDGYGAGTWEVPDDGGTLTVTYEGTGHPDDTGTITFAAESASTRVEGTVAYKIRCNDTEA